MSGIGAEGRKAQKPVTGVHVPKVDLKEAKEAVGALPGPALDGEGADGLLPRHTFTLDHTDARGRRWTGGFHAHVLTYAEKIKVGLLRARLSGHAPPASIDALTGDLLEMQAHLAVALDDAPQWANNLMDLYDPGVVAAIYREVASYEERFHGAAHGAPDAGAAADARGSDAEGVVHEDG